jgi:transposase InsO family protein
MFDKCMEIIKILAFKVLLECLKKHYNSRDHYNSRSQIDLVDMSSLPDNSHDPPYRYIFNCQDHLTKFCHLRPCTTKGAVEVANHLYHIFCEFGAPIILHSDNGLEFRNQVVSSLKLIWPGLQLVHGQSRTPKTQGSVERANGDFQRINVVNGHFVYL